jgi:deoxyhypusine synthase
MSRNAKKHLLNHPVIPFEISKNTSVRKALQKLSMTSFQARQLGHALVVFEKMLYDRVAIFMGFAGAMVPAGMREVVVYLMKNKLIDCFVSTGANLFHDTHETLGFNNYIGSPDVNDELLRKSRIDRIYDVFADDLEFEEVDRYIMKFAEGLEDSRPYTTREFFYKFGERLSRDAKRDGIITSAYRSGIPIYCPAIGDSSFGIALTYLRTKKKKTITFDVVGDVLETTDIVISAPGSAEFIIGGGTPKNFIQQTEVTANICGHVVEGLRYAIQLTQDSPVWGGLSGCTFDEAKSWGKIAFDAKKVVVYVDSTIGLPLIVSAISEKKIKREPPLKMDISGRELKITKR